MAGQEIITRRRKWSPAQKAALARLEGQIAISTLLRRLPELRLAVK